MPVQIFVNVLVLAEMATLGELEEAIVLGVLVDVVFLAADIRRFRHPVESFWRHKDPGLPGSFATPVGCAARAGGDPGARLSSRGSNARSPMPDFLSAAAIASAGLPAFRLRWVDCWRCCGVSVATP